MAVSWPAPVHKRRRSLMAAIDPPPSPSAASSLVKELLCLIQEVAGCERIGVCQKRNVANIIRRIKLLSPLFEEIKDSRPALPPSAALAFRDLHVMMQRSKLLLDDCSDGSCFWLLMENESMAQQFHELTQSMAVALDGLPLDLLELSDEVREQVELVRIQVKRAKCFLDPVEIQLREEVHALLKDVERKEAPDSAQLRKLFAKLHLFSSKDCQKELERLGEEMSNDSSSNEIILTSLISFVRYGKCVLLDGVTELVNSVDSSRDPTTYPDSGEVSTSGREPVGRVNPPDEFRCPISLDLMRDPVIVSTGQTYDRASISRWLQAGHSTCPKSGQKLLHTSLIPNYALRSLISQWCEDHRMPFEKPDKVGKKGNGADHIATSSAALEVTKMTASFLVGKLASTENPEVKKQVAYELRLLAKCGMENRMCIAEAGAVPFLVPLLSSCDSKTQENAVTALLNLSIYDNNKSLIVDAGALDPILEVLRTGGSMEARENAAATLFSLSVVDQYKILIGDIPVAIPALVKLLCEGTTRGKKDAATALFNLAVYHGNKAKIVASGAIRVLVALLADEEAGITDDAVAVLALVAGSAEGLSAIRETDAIPVLVSLLRSASPKGKENSIAVLLALCRNGGDQTLSKLLQVNTAVPSLYTLLTMGTPRAKRKAGSLLKLLHRSEPMSSTTR